MNKKIFLIVAIVIGLIAFNILSSSKTVEHKSAKSTRLPCHKEKVTFERVLKPKMIDILLQNLKAKHYTLDVWADKAKYMKSVMFNYVDIDFIKKDIQQKIQSYPLDIKAEKNADIFIDVMVYENDKKDPGKKTKRSKLYAGYIEFTIKVNKKVVYKIQTDFMDLKGKDIPKRISCIVKSIMTLKR